MVSEKVVVVLIIVAIIFSVVSMVLNLSLINFEFKPIEIRIPSQVADGNSQGNIKLYIEGNPSNK